MRVTVAGCLCVSEREREMRWEQAAAVALSLWRDRDECGGRLCFKSTWKSETHKCDVCIYRGEDSPPPPYSASMKSSWVLHIWKHYCVWRYTALHLAKALFLGCFFFVLVFIRTHTFSITLSFLAYGVHIYHMSKAAPVPVYFTQLSGEWLRLFLASVEERPFVHGNSQCNPVRFHKCLLDKWRLNVTEHKWENLLHLKYVRNWASCNKYLIYPLTCRTGKSSSDIFLI